MAVNRLCAAFRQIAIKRQNPTITRYCSSFPTKEQNNGIPPQFPGNELHVPYTETPIRFVPGSLKIDFGIPSNNIRSIIESPITNISSIEEPLSRRPVQKDIPLTEKSLELPTNGTITEKLAVRLIVIRRQKMKKHKRKKLRKRMQFVWAKIRQKRNLTKEKLFQAELITKIKDAQKFDAKEYVDNKIACLKREILPKTYRGEILPPGMIKQFLEEKQKKKEEKLNKIRLTLD